MGLFGIFRGKNNLPIIVEESTAAIKPQIEAARSHYSSTDAFDATLASISTAAFLHGFVLYFASKHRESSPELLWAAVVQTFDQVFGTRLGGEITLSLQRALRDGTAEHWILEGAEAAKYFDDGGLKLLTSFLEGGSS